MTTIAVDTFTAVLVPGIDPDGSQDFIAIHGIPDLDLHAASTVWDKETDAPVLTIAVEPGSGEPEWFDEFFDRGFSVIGRGASVMGGNVWTLIYRKNSATQQVL